MNENEHSWHLAKKGLERFFDEGMTRWSKQDFFKLFPNDEIASSDYVAEKLRELADGGKIEIIGSDELFIHVITM